MGSSAAGYLYCSMAKSTFEYTEGKLYINGLEKNPSIVSKARYALGLKKEKPANAKKCSADYWLEVVAALGKHYRVKKEQVEKAKRSRIYLK